MRVVCISDTHCLHERIRVKDGDILIHAGDFTDIGNPIDVINFARWMAKLPHQHKVVIAGNHDFCFQNENQSFVRSELANNGITYLQDSGVEIEGIHIYGTPWQPRFHNWAFNLETEDEMQEKWAMIPENTDILIVHGPPFMVLDKTMEGRFTGSKTLRDCIQQISPQLVVCGHIHESQGVYELNGTKVVNASCVRRNMLVQETQSFLFEINKRETT